ncbi:hypothetical protein CEXT_777761 [Caerostris extrusa]|uniref:G-protein coupled receptors family 2 profile 1 domain-containing protein n=1 Tax=Caerostris extrusa TaxID=172846 RepID=A0AAV4W2P8_CAEEX|nr:hypothetical protein CEXT_777761 [Caerostris extrusa]
MLDSLYCPRTWDGWQCWDDTKAGETASSPCLEHVYFRSEPSTCPKKRHPFQSQQGKYHRFSLNRLNVINR